MPREWQPKIRKPGSDPATFSCVVYGKPGVGKTTFARDWGRCLGGETFFVSAEDTMTELEVLEPWQCETWEDVEEGVDQFLALKKSDFPCTAIETADKLALLAESWVCADANVTTLNQAYGGYGRGHVRVAELIDGLLTDIRKAGRGIIVVSHERMTELITPEGTTLQTITPTVSGKAAVVFQRLVGNILWITHPVMTVKTQVVEQRGQKKQKRTVNCEKFLTEWMSNDTDEYALLEQMRPRDRICVCEGTRYWTAKTWSDGADFPMFIPLQHPADGNTVEPLFNFLMEIRTSASARAAVRKTATPKAAKSARRRK